MDYYGRSALLASHLKMCIVNRTHTVCRMKMCGFYGMGFTCGSMNGLYIFPFSQSARLYKLFQNSEQASCQPFPPSATNTKLFVCRYAICVILPILSYFLDK